MIKKFGFSLCLLTTMIWAGSHQTIVLAQETVPPTPPEVPKETPSLPPTTPQQVYSNAVLTLQDLPPGFKELPPEITAQIQTQFDILSTQLAKAGLKPEKYFAFVNPDNLQLVVGFTGVIPNQSDRANFDSTLKQMQQPEYQQQMITQIRQSIKPDQSIQIQEYATSPTANNIAETSTGMTVTVNMQGQPLRLDLAAFRRSNVGAFTAIMYRSGEKPTVNVDDVARKLDTRIVQTSPGAIPTGAVNPTVTPVAIPVQRR